MPRATACVSRPRRRLADADPAASRKVVAGTAATVGGGLLRKSRRRLEKSAAMDYIGRSAVWGGKWIPGLEVACRGLRLPDSDICESKVEPDRRTRSQGAACGCRAGAPRPCFSRRPGWRHPAAAARPACSHLSACPASGSRPGPPVALRRFPLLAQLPLACPGAVSVAAAAAESAACGPRRVIACAGGRTSRPRRGGNALAALVEATGKPANTLFRSANPRPVAGEGLFVRRWRDWHANDVFP